MKSKKGLVSFILILLLAAAVFAIGWIQLYVPVEHYGVLVSKTNGVDPNVIQQGELTWKWQRLLPTNTVIHVFEAAGEKNVVTVSDTLPSADIYSSLIEGRPDFSYSFTFEIEASVKPENLPALVKDAGVKSDEDLNEVLRKASTDAAEKAVKIILDGMAETSDELVSFLNDETLLLPKVNEAVSNGNADIIGIRIIYSKLPDIQLYNIAKNIYTTYLENISDVLVETTESQLELASNDFLLIERFGKLGKVLTDYPILIDYLAVTRDDPDGALGLLDSLRKSE